MESDFPSRDRGPSAGLHRVFVLSLLLVVAAGCGGGGSGGSSGVPFDPNAGYDDVALVLLTTELDYGELFLGEDSTQKVRILNQHSEETLTIEECDLPSLEFQITNASFPLSLPPGKVTEITVRFTPITEGPHDGDLVLSRAGPGTSFTVKLAATGRVRAADEVIDFGEQTLDGSGSTPLMSIELPDDAVSFAIEAIGPMTDTIELLTLTGPGGKVYENSQSNGPYMWGSKLIYNPPLPPFTRNAVLYSVPNSDFPSAQLVPGGGTYSFRLRRTAGTGTAMRVRVFIKRRIPRVADFGIIDVNVFLGKSILPTAETAEEDENLKETIATFDATMRTVGIRLGKISYYDIEDSRYDLVTPAEYNPMIKLSAGAKESRANIFVIEDIRNERGGRLIGLAADIPAPFEKGTFFSGAACGYITDDPGLLGRIMAHEIGHTLGLYHTRQGAGIYDLLSDTSSSPVADRNVMNPDGPGTLLSFGQGMVMRSHPSIRLDPEAPYPPPAPLLRLPTSDAQRKALDSLPEGWCGTCSPQK